MNNDFGTDWDPYDHMVKLTNTVNEIAAAHNRLAHQCLELEHQLRKCQQQIKNLTSQWPSTTVPAERPLRD
jgi:hypothetical protein